MSDAATHPTAAPPDWARPWFAPWARHGQGAWQAWQSSGDVHAALNASGRAPVRFVLPDALPPGRRGLANVRARVQALGARCAWTPEGGGTAFTLWLPLRRAAG